MIREARDALASSIGVWFRSTAGRSRTSDIRRDLAAVGLRACERPEATSASAVLLIEGVTDAVIEQLEEMNHDSEGRVLVVTCGTTGADETWALSRHGAADVIAWDLATGAERVAAKVARAAEVDEILRSRAIAERLAGTGRAWTSLLRGVVEAARFTQAPILLTGETGTGKELVAHLIHDLDGRTDKGAFVIIDCTNVVPTLSGSEFFGHEKGAFTGAVSARDGAFALADGGTLFLDEVGELTPTLQAELLRVIQEGTYKRVGGNAWRRTAFRLICATNRQLAPEVAADRFRPDLYYRVAAWTFRLPSLHERREDIAPLVRWFLSKARPCEPAVEPDAAVWRMLLQREYSGNVRDLRQLLFRIAQRHVGPGPITIGSVPLEDRPHALDHAVEETAGSFVEAIRREVARGATLRDIARKATETAVNVAMAEEQANLHRAAVRLGVTDRTLQIRRARRQKPALAHPAASADATDRTGGVGTPSSAT